MFYTPSCGCCVTLTLRRFLHNHGNISIEGDPKSGLNPFIEWIQGFIIVHTSINSTAHSWPLNSLQHCVCTTSMKSIWPDRDSNPVHLSFEPQPDRMSHRGRLLCVGVKVCGFRETCDADPTFKKHCLNVSCLLCWHRWYINMGEIKLLSELICWTKGLISPECLVLARCRG